MYIILYFSQQIPSKSTLNWFWTPIIRIKKNYLYYKWNRCLSFHPTCFGQNILFCSRTAAESVRTYCTPGALSRTPCWWRQCNSCKHCPSCQLQTRRREEEESPALLMFQFSALSSLIFSPLFAQGLRVLCELDMRMLSSLSLFTFTHESR